MSQFLLATINLGCCCVLLATATILQKNVKITPITVPMTMNGTYISNPGDMTFPGIIQYSFPAAPNLCQLRLDLTQFFLDNPSHFIRTCDTDVLIFDGAANTKYFEKVCGNLTGQHVYLNYADADTDITVSIYTFVDLGQYWWMKVTGIMCDGVDLAPEGCLQYYTGLTGTVQSFNYLNKLQLNDEDYSVCIKRHKGLNKITWRSCDFYAFIISGEPPIPPPNGTNLPPITNPLSGNDCYSDWLMISGINKFCGNAFPGYVTAITQPWQLQVHFDGQELVSNPGNPDYHDDMNTGFCLIYTQSP